VNGDPKPLSNSSSSSEFIAFNSAILFFCSFHSNPSPVTSKINEFGSTLLEIIFILSNTF
jgi:hypothetical protein